MLLVNRLPQATLCHCSAVPEDNSQVDCACRAQSALVEWNQMYGRKNFGKVKPPSATKHFHVWAINSTHSKHPSYSFSVPKLSNLILSYQMVSIDSCYVLDTHPRGPRFQDESSQTIDLEIRHFSLIATNSTYSPLGPGRVASERAHAKRVGERVGAIRVIHAPSPCQINCSIHPFGELFTSKTT